MASPPTRVAKIFFSTRQQPHPPFFRNTFSQINLFIRGVHACGECVRLWPVTKALRSRRAKSHLGLIRAEVYSLTGALCRQQIANSAMQVCKQTLHPSLRSAALYTVRPRPLRAPLHPPTACPTSGRGRWQAQPPLYKGGCANPQGATTSENWWVASWGAPGN